MRYGCPYKVIQLDDQSMNVVKRAINSTELLWEESIVHDDTSNRKPRQSEVAWINNQHLDNLLLKYAQYINAGCGWNLKITGVEPIQFGSYPVGGFYDWHVDQHSIPEKVVRKLSMSLFLNEDYTGGEFDLEIYINQGQTQDLKHSNCQKGLQYFFKVTSGIGLDLLLLD